LTVLSSPLPPTNEEWATGKILLEKDVPDVTTVVDRQGCYNLGNMVIPAPSINKLKHMLSIHEEISCFSNKGSFQFFKFFINIPDRLHGRLQTVVCNIT
jgi:hypothetical protein